MTKQKQIEAIFLINIAEEHYEKGDINTAIDLYSKAAWTK